MSQTTMSIEAMSKYDSSMVTMGYEVSRMENSVVYRRGTRKEAWVLLDGNWHFHSVDDFS